MLAARFGEGIDHVVCVLLQRVVHARLGRRATPIVIDAQTATDIDVADVHAKPSQLGVVARHLLQPGLDVPDVSDLRAEVKVNQLENIETTEALELVDEPYELGGAQAELGFLAATLRPAARTLGVKLDAHSGGGRDTELVCHLEQHIDLAELLEHDENLVPKLLAHERQTHELFVLVTIADDHMIGVLRETEHCLQLRLAAALEAYSRDFSEFDDLFHHVTLLIDLDRVNGGIAALVPILLARSGEFLVQ